MVCQTLLAPVPAAGTEGLGGSGLTKMTTGVGDLQQGGDTGWAWGTLRPGSFSMSFGRVSPLKRGPPTRGYPLQGISRWEGLPRIHEGWKWPRGCCFPNFRDDTCVFN